jgi:hypothetical protein
VDLLEEDFFGRSFDGLPRLDFSLQGAELAIRELVWELSLKILEKGFGLEAGIEKELITELGPDVLERVLTGPPGFWGERFTGQPLGVPILASSLVVHTHLKSGKIEGKSLAEELAKPANLGVLDHGGILLTRR